MLSVRSLATCVALMSAAGQAQYTLEDDFLEGGNFFKQFDFFSASDPTHGNVRYVDAGTAASNNYANVTSSGQVYMGMNYNDKQASRDSVRVASRKTYDSGLIILDLAHMPASTCGTWPAFWTVGSDWPNNGEIDIIEGVNQQASNAVTLHTNDGCVNKASGSMSGHVTTSNCNVKAAGQAENQGCGVSTPSQASYGTGFNSAGGGVYATQWTDSFIKVFFFGRGSIPSDIASGSPDPTKWGTPAASFDGCSYPSHFKAHQIVFDITTCGDWAGGVWGETCAASTGVSKCEDYVKNNPAAFRDSYWLVNSLKVYQTNGSGSKQPSVAASPAAASPAASSPTTTAAAAPVAAQTSSPAAVAPAPAATTAAAAAPAAPAAPPAGPPSNSGPLGLGANGAVQVPAGNRHGH